MLRLLEDLLGYTIIATDDSLGEVRDILFDDEKWAVRNLVVQVGGLIDSRSALISPISVEGIDHEARTIQLSLSRRDVEDAPVLEANPPVSRQYEESYYAHHRWMPYWAGPSLWGFGGSPAMMRTGAGPADTSAGLTQDFEQQASDHDPHLRSFNVVNGYSVEATDGAMGDIEDLIFDDETWRIHYLVVDTRKYFPSKDVLVPPSAARSISFPDSKVRLDMTREQISGRPEFKSIADIQGVTDDDIVRIEHDDQRRP